MRREVILHGVDVIIILLVIPLPGQNMLLGTVIVYTITIEVMNIYIMQPEEHMQVVCIRQSLYF